MHSFNRGFNGHAVSLNAGPKVGPVTMNVVAAPAPAPPILSSGFMAQGQQAVQAPRVGLVAQAPRAPVVAPGAQKAPAAAPTAPGAVPMGKKTDCPVCRTFGG